MQVLEPERGRWTHADSRPDAREPCDGTASANVACGRFLTVTLLPGDDRVGQAGKRVRLGFDRGPIAQLGERFRGDRAEAGQFGPRQIGPEQPGQRAGDRRTGDRDPVDAAAGAAGSALRRRPPARRRSNRPRPDRPRRRQHATARPALRGRGWRGSTRHRRPAASGASASANDSARNSGGTRSACKW